MCVGGGGCGEELGQQRGRNGAVMASADMWGGVESWVGFCSGKGCVCVGWGVK